MKTQTKTKPKILKVLAICILFLGQSHLMAQTLPDDSPIQTICVGSLVEPYEVVPIATSSYSWSMIDQSTGNPPLAGIANITNTANDWYITVDWTTPGVYTLSIIETDIATTCTSLLVDLVVTVEDLASPPVAANPAAICLGDLNPQMTAATGGGTGNGVFNWYADAGLTTLLQANSATYTDPTPYPIAGTYDYWVTEESANACEGSAIQVTVTVTALPLVPTLANLPYEACFGLANPLFTASGAGTNFNWYDVDPAITPGAIALATGIYQYTSTEVSGTFTYWVEEVVGSCTSPATSFTFTIHALPTAPSITPLIALSPAITICEGETPSDFIVTSNNPSAGTFTWYSDVALTTSVGSGTPFTPTQTAPGIYDYWLTETDLTTTCVSTAAIATFTINELPLVPTVSPSTLVTICLNDPNPIFTASNGGGVGTSDFIWYDASMIQVGTGLTFTPTQTAAGGPWTFYVTETDAGTNCEGPPLSFTFEIIDLPVAPLCTDEEICLGDPLPTFTPSTGNNLIWYDDAVLILANQVGVGPTYIAGTNQTSVPSAVGTYSYWVVDQPGTCVSPPLQVDLIINPLPTPGPIWHNN